MLHMFKGFETILIIQSTDMLLPELLEVLRKYTYNEKAFACPCSIRD